MIENVYCNNQNEKISTLEAMKILVADIQKGVTASVGVRYYNALHQVNYPLPLRINYGSGVCCGWKDLYFGGATENKLDEQFRIDVLLRDVISYWRDNMVPVYIRTGSSLGLTATLAEYQKPIADILVNFGFKPIYSFVNANSNKTCTFYVLALTKERKAPELV